MNNNHNSPLIIFQKKIKFNRIKDSLKKIRALGLDTLIQKNQSYDETVKILCDKKTIDCFDEFLTRINRIIDPSSVDYKGRQKNLSRILLSAYLLKYYSEDVFTNIDIQIKIQLCEMGSSLVKIIEHTFLSSNIYRTFSLEMFGFIFNTYVVNYRIILEADKQHLIKELYKEFVNLSRTKSYVVKGTKYDDAQKVKIIMVLDGSIYNVFRHIKLIDTKFDIKRINKTYLMEEKTKTSFSDQFWESLGSEIDLGNFENVIKLLDKIKLIICDMSPTSTKQSIKLELDEYLDIDFIKQKLGFNVMSKIEIMNLCQYVWKKLESLQSSARDSDSMITWNNLSIMFMESASFGKTVSDFFKSSFKTIDDILCDAMLYPLMIDMNMKPNLN